MASLIDLRDRHLARLGSMAVGESAAAVASADAQPSAEPAPARGKVPSSVSH
jgi:hypothetical protein